MPRAKPKSEPTPIAASAPERKDTDYDEITYIPENGDPVRVRWNGLEFTAHVARKIPRTMTVLSLIRKETDMPDGTTQSRAVEKRVPLVELAKGNCRFMVNGKKPQAVGGGEGQRTPKTASEYKGYALEWIAGSTQATAMDARWNAEEPLRDKCEVGDDEIRYLRPFFEARHEALGGGGHKPMREVRMGLTRAELELDARTD
ncbi:MAG TPA: hypothetical protein VFV12_08780 [Xanthobacteraceae bacterium]|nr:hypothetical protein [Xanthobacteraceae bacterium]